ncbi:uncharacterized protein LOC143231893 isoform X2 [Tachypleus tridentatus]|uniref:uncharacterized protein LOC143231893 isoform X2 n=1 Tax=Tachypleus tridentatus TaxID=6853 RepID=UPI003FD64ACB
MLLVMVFSCLLATKVRQSARVFLFIPLTASKSQPDILSWNLIDEEVIDINDLRSSAKASSLFLLLRKKRDAARLWERCEYNISCTFYDEHAVCNEDGECRCDEGFRSHKDAGQEICIPDEGRGILDNSDITTVIMVVAGLMIGIALFCLVLRLFSRARFGRGRERFGNAAAPSVVLTEMEEPGSVPHSRRTSRCSSSNEYLPGSRRASYSMLAPPTSAGSRRSSSGSVRSQSSVRSHASSIRSQSSLRSYRGGRRDSVRRTRSSPTEASTSKFNQLEQRSLAMEHGKEVSAMENPFSIKEENDK